MSEDTLVLLSQIRDLCDSLKQHAELQLEQSLAHRVSYSTIVPAPTIELPTINDITYPLVQAGAPLSTAAELAGIHIDRAKELADRYTAAHAELHSEQLEGCLTEALRQRAALRLSTRVEHLIKMYKNTISEWEVDLTRTVRARFETHKLAAEASNHKKSVFNYGYVPKLEAFFSLNKFPSRADRVFLAKQSGMTLRQINVWFQNRRSRSKSEINLRKECHAVESLPESCPETTSRSSSIDGETTDVEEYESTWSRSSSFTVVVEDSPFTTPSPYFAFPTPYPPTIREDPFPCCRGDFSFPKPQWLRHSSEDDSRTFAQPDMDQLMMQFEHLTISDLSLDGYGLKGVKPSWHSVSFRGLSAADMTTTTPQAPLPSLILHQRSHLRMHDDSDKGRSLQLRTWLSKLRCEPPAASSLKDCKDQINSRVRKPSLPRRSPPCRISSRRTPFNFKWLSPRRSLPSQPPIDQTSILSHRKNNVTPILS